MSSRVDALANERADLMFGSELQQAVKEPESDV